MTRRIKIDTPEACLGRTVWYDLGVPGAEKEVWMKVERMEVDAHFKDRSIWLHGMTTRSGFDRTEIPRIGAWCWSTLKKMLYLKQPAYIKNWQRRLES